MPLMPLFSPCVAHIRRSGPKGSELTCVQAPAPFSSPLPAVFLKLSQLLFVLTQKFTAPLLTWAVLATTHTAFNCPCRLVFDDVLQTMADRQAVVDKVQQAFMAFDPEKKGVIPVRTAFFLARLAFSFFGFRCSPFLDARPILVH